MPTSVNQIDRVDIVFAEGTLSACHAAIEAAAAGLEVAVVCGGASLAPEITTTLRLWADAEKVDRATGKLGNVLKSSLRDGGERPLYHAGKLSESLEDLLIDSGVSFYYRAQTVGIVTREGATAGVLVAGKFGVGIIRATTVVDCTPLATAARIAGAEVTRRNDGPVAMRQVIHLIGETVPEVPAGGITVAGTYGPLLEFAFTTDADPHDPLFLSKAAFDGRIAVMDAGAPLPGQPLRSAEQPIYDPQFSLAVADNVAGIAGLHAFGPASASDSDAKELCFSPLRAIDYGADRAAAIVTEAKKRASDGSGSLDTDLQIRASLPSADGSVRGDRLHLSDPSYREPDVKPVDAALADLPTLLSAELIVGGGGTCGVAATIEGARSGLDTLCVEGNADLGGAHTVGGVSHFWFGRWPKHMVDHYLELKRIALRRNLPWGIAQAALARESGAKIAPLLSVAGTVDGPQKLGGLVVATSAGLAVVEGEYFLDSTGDGDVAAFAGCPYTYGSERDEITLWFSFGKFQGDRNEASRNYRSVVDQRSVRDTSRAIVSSKRMLGIFGEGEFPQFNIATRETRHITGRARLGYRDVIAGTRVPDVVLVYRSNVDIKGMASSDEAMLGFVERDYTRNWWCQVPYGAIVPKDSENLLIVGKAYSVSHDGLAMARMQADITDMGAVAGIAAGLAKRTGKGFHALEVGELQRLLVENGILEAADLPGAKPMEETTDDGMLECLTDRALTGPMELDEQMRLAGGGDRSVPFLLEAIKQDYKGNYMKAIALQLALQRRTEGGHILERLVDEALEAEDLPSIWKYPDKLRPDHGWAPDPTYWINAMGLSRDKRVIPLLQKLADRIDLSDPPSTFRFNYVHSVSYALERIADSDGIPILKQLLDVPVLHDRTQPRGSDPRDSVDYVAERCAYLELCLGRALARCGDKRGYQVLASYTADHRIFLARSAVAELMELTGVDHGFDTAAWRRWIDVNDGKIQPTPLDRAID